MQLLEEVSGDNVVVDRGDCGRGSIARLQVSSAVMVAYLVAIEDEFSFLWDDDIHPDVFDAFQTLAAFVDSRLPTPAGEASR
jgi:hypothetical protein